MNTKESKTKAHQEMVAELKTLIAQAKKGDTQVLPRLRLYLDRHPELWTQGGDVALQAQGAWMTLIAGPNLHFRECMERKVNQMKQELLGPSPSPMESLVADRIILSWLRVYYYECKDAQHDEQSLKWAEFRLKQYRTMADLHIKSIGALATLRKLLPRAVVPGVEPPQQKQTLINNKAASKQPLTVEPTSDAEDYKSMNGQHTNVHNRLSELFAMETGILGDGSHLEIQNHAA